MPAYVQLSTRDKCYVSPCIEHQGCLYSGDVSFCRKKCDDDIMCKGYSAKLGNSKNCQVTTTSNCSDISDRVNGDVAPLDSSPSCLVDGGYTEARLFWQGCWVKMSEGNVFNIDVIQCWHSLNLLREFRI